MNNLYRMTGLVSGNFVSGLPGGSHSLERFSIPSVEIAHSCLASKPLPRLEILPEIFSC